MSGQTGADFALIRIPECCSNCPRNQYMDPSTLKTVRVTKTQANPTSGPVFILLNENKVLEAFLDEDPSYFVSGQIAYETNALHLDTILGMSSLTGP